VQLFRGLRVLQRAWSGAMGSDTFDVGSQSQPRVDRARITTDMAQQRNAAGASENEAAQQKLIHLVGYRIAGCRNIIARGGSRRVPNSRRI
jgi:hypothetical protein